jgi:hypothetical protein
LDDRFARAIAESWSGSGGLVPRGPRSLLAVVPVTLSEIERHTGSRPAASSELWRIEVSGRFLRSGGLVYPGGVPFPEELHARTAVIANEVWLYVDEDGDVLGTYWWPDALRRPVAAQPEADFDDDQIVHPADVSGRFAFTPKRPTHTDWETSMIVCVSPSEAVVLCASGVIPEPLNEMVIYAGGGLGLRMRSERRPDLDAFLETNQPPYRRVNAGPRSVAGVGRDIGRALGPQTWPWPAELRWWEDGVSYEVKAFQPLATLQTAAASLAEWDEVP